MLFNKRHIQFYIKQQASLQGGKRVLAKHSPVFA